MALLDVKVKIELSKATGGVGFGIPLLLECGAESATPYTECYSLEDVVTAGFANGTEMHKAANMVFAQENRPAKIAICGATGTAVEALATVVAKDWRQLVLVNSNVSEYVAVADFIEATDSTYRKMFFVSMSKSAFETFAEGLAGKDYKRTVIFINEAEYANAGLVGEMAGRIPGSYTYKFKTVKGAIVEDFAEGEIEALHESGAFTYVMKAGDEKTSEGISQNGTFIDQTDCIDYVIQNIEYRVQKTFNDNAIVTYDNRGISLLESAVVSALQDAFTNGVIAVKEDGVTADYSVSFAPRSQTTEADRVSRVYKYGSFSFALAGAIHKCEVFGEITQ